MGWGDADLAGSRARRPLTAPLLRQLIRAFGKRVFTDRIIRGFTLLLLLGVVAIVVIATVFPDQTTFDVPDEAKPPVDDATDAANSAKDQAGS